MKALMVDINFKMLAIIRTIQCMQFLGILLTLHFCHYIRHYICIKCQLGNRKRASRKKRLGVLESLGPKEWESVQSAKHFRLVFPYVVKLCHPTSLPSLLPKF